MSERPSPAAEAMHNGSVSLGEGVYRYFFFGWLFPDAGIGSGVERAIALRHNRSQAKWLPGYMLRWAVGGAAIWALETLSEYAVGQPVLSDALAMALIFVVLFLLITAICWTFLRVAGRNRQGALATCPKHIIEPGWCPTVDPARYRRSRPRPAGAHIFGATWTTPEPSSSGGIGANWNHHPGDESDDIGRLL